MTQLVEYSSMNPRASGSSPSFLNQTLKPCSSSVVVVVVVILILSSNVHYSLVVFSGFREK